MEFYIRPVLSLSPRESVASASEPGEGAISFFSKGCDLESYMDYFPSPQPLSGRERGWGEGVSHA